MECSARDGVQGCGTVMKRGLSRNKGAPMMKLKLDFFYLFILFFFTLYFFGEKFCYVRAD